MSERKELGKIQSISVGWGGYQDAMFGVSVSLGGDGWGVGDFKGTWGIERSENAQWTEAGRVTHLGETMIWLRDLLTAAKKTKVEQLAGTPVEITFDGMTMKSWRVLKEVL